jgi:arylsulfatase A-like enzyme
LDPALIEYVFLSQIFTVVMLGNLVCLNLAGFTCKTCVYLRQKSTYLVLRQAYPLPKSASFSIFKRKSMKLQQLPLFLFFLALSFSCSLSEEEPLSPPNIILIISDDHAYQAISAYGSKLIQTPNIDRIGAQGVRFDRAFVTNSICSPSRAVIITGKHSHINGLKDNIQVFDSTQQTFPKILRNNGYQTAVLGKWHLKSQPTGFDYWRVLPDQGHYYTPEFRTPEGLDTLEGYVTDVITDLAIHWLDNLRNDTMPFMLMYNHKAPHREWLPGPDHLGAFMDAPLPEPATLFDDYSARGRAAKEAEMRISDHMGLTNDNKIHPGIVDSLGFEEFMGWYAPVSLRNVGRMNAEDRKNWEAVYGPINEYFKNNTPSGDELTRWKYQRYMQDYLACIQSLDDNIGRLMTHLEEQGLAENTLLIYISDQGFYLGEHGWFDKRFMYEESFRTPLLMQWPGTIEPGTVNTDLVQNLDIAETILDAAGLDIPEDMQGRSLMPLLQGKPVEWRDALYYHYFEYPGIHAVKRHYGVRTDRYKLIHFYNDIDEWELYDLQEDPQEMKNVIEEPEYQEIKDQLMKRLSDLQEQYGDEI